jgi:hypothetical protein
MHTGGDAFICKRLNIRHPDRTRPVATFNRSYDLMVSVIPNNQDIMFSREAGVAINQSARGGFYARVRPC